MSPNDIDALVTFTDLSRPRNPRYRVAIGSTVVGDCTSEDTRDAWMRGIRHDLRARLGSAAGTRLPEMGSGGAR